MSTLSIFTASEWNNAAALAQIPQSTHLFASHWWANYGYIAISAQSGNCRLRAATTCRRALRSTTRSWNG